MNIQKFISKQTNILNYFNKTTTITPSTSPTTFTKNIELNQEINVEQNVKFIKKKRFITDFIPVYKENSLNDIDIDIDNTDINIYKYNINEFDKRIEVYTDGSSFNNGKKNCKASWAYNIYENDNLIYKDCGKCNMLKQQSNQNAELLGIYHSVLKCHNVYQNINKIYLYTDSMYSIKCINEWSNKWSASDWDIKKNTEIILNIKNVISKCNFEVIFIHIRSHQNNSLNKHHIRNNIVDKDAKKINQSNFQKY